MIFVGVDPGISGGIACLDTEKNFLWAVEMPVNKNQKTKKSEYDISRIATLLRAAKPDHVCLEAVHSMPGQGVSSTFLFGKGFGILLGVIGTLDIPLTLVPPRVWKKKYLLGSDKNVSRQRATEFFPACSNFWKLKKHDGLAEAALLTHFACTTTLDLIMPGDIWELYQIEVNKRGRKK